MSDPTITLITGTNRGIGNGILARFLARDNNIVIAGVRDPQAPVSQNLHKLPKGEGSKLIIVKIDIGVDTDAGNAIKGLVENENITRLDRVLANAAIGDVADSVSNTSLDDLRRHLDTNFIGAFTLFQATAPLLQKSSNPKFFVMGSALGSSGLMGVMGGPWICYGASKAASHYMVQKIHQENEWLTSVLINPGWVKTDMGGYAAKIYGAPEAAVELDDSVNGCVKLIDEATRDNFSGKFISYELQPTPW